MSVTNFALLLSTVEQAEGFSPSGAPDVGGTLQVGFGRNLTTDPLTRAEAAFLSTGPLQASIAFLTATLPWYAALDDVRSRTFAEMDYQLGGGGILGFKDMLACAAKGDWTGAGQNVLTNADGSPTELAIETPARAERYAYCLRTGLDYVAAA